MMNQGIDRKTLPYRGKFQLYTSNVAMTGCVIMILLLGYDLFIACGWSMTYLFLDYTFLAAFPLGFIVWKIVKKTEYVKIGTADLGVRGLVREINLYEQLELVKRKTRF